MSKRCCKVPVGRAAAFTGWILICVPARMTTLSAVPLFGPGDVNGRSGPTADELVSTQA